MQQIQDLIDRYIAIWNEHDPTRRRELIAQTWTPDASYLDPMMHGDGHDGIDAMIDSVQQRFPGHLFRRVGEADMHHDYVRFSWECGPAKRDADNAMHLRGTDFGAIIDGRLHSVVGYLDADPAQAGSTQKAAGWSVDSFAAFWKKPNPALVARALTSDVVGYWPGAAEPVRGKDAYVQRIADLVAMVPDFSLEVAEHAINGDDVFIRWIARGTADGQALEFSGVDRVRVRDGLVAENRIYCDHPLIHALAARTVSHFNFHHAV